VGRYRCSTHNVEYNNSCPECRHEEIAESQQNLVDGLSELLEARESATEEIKECLEDLAYKQANPGDYRCPECLFITLKRNSRRCPKCLSNISGEYWKETFEKERIKAEQEAIRQKAAAEEAARLRKIQTETSRLQKIKEKKEDGAVAYWLYWFPSLSLFGYCLMLISRYNGYFSDGEEFLYILPLAVCFIPLINWLAIAGGIIAYLGGMRDTPSHPEALFMSLAMFFLIGLMVTTGIMGNSEKN